MAAQLDAQRTAALHQQQMNAIHERGSVTSRHGTMSQSQRLTHATAVASSSARHHGHDRPVTSSHHTTRDIILPVNNNHTSAQAASRSFSATAPMPSAVKPTSPGVILTLARPASAHLQFPVRTTSATVHSNPIIIPSSSSMTSPSPPSTARGGSQTTRVGSSRSQWRSLRQSKADEQRAASRDAQRIAASATVFTGGGLGWVYHEEATKPFATPLFRRQDINYDTCSDAAKITVRLQSPVTEPAVPLTARKRAQLAAAAAAAANGGTATAQTLKQSANNNMTSPVRTSTVTAFSPATVVY
jgi:hypothetical protein